MLITIEKVLALKQMPFFKNVSNMALSDLMSVSEEETIKKGTILIDEHEQNHTIYFVLMGSALAVSSRTEEKKFFSSQQMIGLDTAFLHASAGITVKADSQMFVLKVSAEKLYRMMSLHPSLGMAILHELSEEIILSRKK